MKDALTLGPKGTRALAALCHHVISNGNMALDAKAIAHVLIATLEAERERETWCEEDRALAGSGGSVKRMRAALRELGIKRDDRGSPTG